MADDYDEDKAMDAAMNVSVANLQFMASVNRNNQRDALATVLDSDDNNPIHNSNEIAYSLADASALSSIMNQFMVKSIQQTLPGGANKSVANKSLAFKPLASAQAAPVKKNG